MKKLEIVTFRPMPEDKCALCDLQITGTGYQFSPASANRYHKDCIEATKDAAEENPEWSKS